MYAVKHLTRMPIFEPMSCGVGGTDAAGYKPHDVCMLTVHIAQLAYKLEGQKLTRMSISDQYLTNRRKNDILVALYARRRKMKHLHSIYTSVSSKLAGYIHTYIL